MGYTLLFKNGDETSESIEYAYGYNMYRNVFDPESHVNKTGTEMSAVLEKAISILEATHPIRSSSRNLLNTSSGNLEVLLRSLRELASKHSNWTFQVN